MLDTPAVATRGSMRDRVEMYNANALKIGLFGANCSSAAHRNRGAGALARILARLSQTRAHSR